VSFPNNGCPSGLHRDPDFGDINGDKGAAIFPSQNAARFHGFPAPAIKAEDSIGLRDRKPTLDVGEFAAMGFARTDMPAIQVSPQRLQLLC